MLLEFRLVIRYHGLKATQYFSKFTDDTVAALREDLISLGLPHPKVQNISLLSHGVIECYWPCARKNHVLHNNLVARTKSTPNFEEMIDLLSISGITLKERPASETAVLTMENPKNLKRPYSKYERGQESEYITHSMKTTAFPTSGHEYPTPAGSGRPHDDSVRPTKIAKTHHQGLHLTAKPQMSRMNSDSHTSGKISHEDKFQGSVSRTDSHINPHASSRAAPLSHVSRSGVTQKAIQSTRQSDTFVGARVEEQAVDDFLNNLKLRPTASSIASSTNSTPAPQPPKTAEVQSNNSVHIVRHSSNSTSTSTRDKGGAPTVINSDKHDGDMPGLDIAKSRMMKTVAQLPNRPVSTHLPIPRKDFTAPQPSKTTEVQSNNAVHIVQRSSNSTSTSTRDKGRAPTVINSDKRDGDMPGLDIAKSRMMKTVAQLPNRPVSSTYLPIPRKDSRPQLALPPQAAIARSPSPSRRASDISRTTQRPPTSSQMSERSQQADRTPRRLDISSVSEKTNESRDRNRQGRGPEYETIIKELKKELEEERRLRVDAKKNLDEERRRREEAEYALADVRRECRQPFVVPSLLDTFVELSRLTTKGLRVSTSSLVSSGYPEPASAQNRFNTTLAANGRDVIEDARQHPIEIPTTVKMEPVDNMLIL